MSFHIIVACNINNGIGKNNNLLYKLKDDMNYFKSITTKVIDKEKKNAVIMGRKTYESIPKKFRPLPYRLNILITRNEDYPKEENLLIANSFEKALEILKLLDNIENIFVIGGGEIYKTALQHPKCKKVYITKIFDDKEADIFFPNLDNSFCLESSLEPRNEVIKSTECTKNIKYQYLVFTKK